MTTTETLFANFRKCLVWHKSGNSWEATFNVAAGEKKGICYSLRGEPGVAAKKSKPAIEQSLFNLVVDYCGRNALDLEYLVKFKLEQKRLAKTRKQ